ncbi:MAG: hypothetical protein GY789_03210 [Hyphomicrobiales bacterium]|nr:hypothetical protein [Hyphomicrobiales bacterium]MCP5000498.1 hypothetical protein [Hyphomicrobiales bacterium]
MRQLYTSLCFVLVSLSFVPSAFADSCGACKSFDAFRIDGGSKLFNEIRARLASRPVARVSLKTGAFCEAGAGAQIASDLVAASDGQFAQANQIAKKIDQCPQACAPKLNDAEFCAYGKRLVIDRYRLGSIGLRLSELARIYERAGHEAQLPVEVLSADMTLYGSEALDVLRRASSSLASGDPAELPDVRWHASATEVAGLFGAVVLLDDFSLIDGDVAQIVSALEKTVSEINTLRDDLHQALTRAKLMELSERLALEERILTGASQLAFAIASLQASVDDARTATLAKTTTDANAVPAGDNPVGIQDTVACLNQLSVIAITGSEAPGMADEVLSDCRSFQPCSGGNPVYLPANISPLKAFLQTQEEAQQQTLAIVKSICAVN